MPSLADYLAKNYLTASSSNADPSDTRPTKKRKKNKVSHTEAASTLLIADDDDDLLLSTKGRAGNDDNDNERPLVYESKARSAEFRKSKKNAWQTLSNGDGETSRKTETSDGGGGGDDDDADRLLRDTIASNARTRADLEAENAPAIVDTSDQGNGLRMESGARAGIQTAADTARLIAEQEARELEEEQRQARARRKKKKATSTTDPEDQPPEEQTVYRDATGRRIDLTLRRQEARKAELDRIAAEKKARDDALGQVQLRQREERKQELEDAKFLSLARGADDEEMNAHLKDQVRWNDPMAAYLATTRDEEDGSQGDKAPASTSRAGRARRSNQLQDSTKPRRKEYAGSAPPNRYGIKPGWRWDGVDRGTGFEKDWFQARGKKARNESLEYQWQMDE